MTSVIAAGPRSSVVPWRVASKSPASRRALLGLLMKKAWYLAAERVRRRARRTPDPTGAPASSSPCWRRGFLISSTDCGRTPRLWRRGGRGCLTNPDDGDVPEVGDLAYDVLQPLPDAPENRARRDPPGVRRPLQAAARRENGALSSSQCDRVAVALLPSSAGREVAGQWRREPPLPMNGGQLRQLLRRPGSPVTRNFTVEPMRWREADRGSARDAFEARTRISIRLTRTMLADWLDGRVA
jgi:hypothetical protein